MNYQHISKAALLLWEIYTAVGYVCLSVFPFVYLEPFSTPWLMILTPILVLYLFFALVYFPLRYRNTKYLITENKICLQSGAIFVKNQVMARSRIIYVALIQNPYTPIFHIGAVSIHAAGAVLHLPYLPVREAKRIAKDLNPELPL